jgi:DNA repair protein RecN (Recombination protein N)
MALLTRLRVRNYGIIEDFDWTPGGGLNVVTGETGAGKSLVVDALGDLVSGRLDEASIRHGASEARIEGVFDLAGRAELIEWLDGKGIDAQDATAILSLDLKRAGRTVIRINGNTVPRSLASEIGRKLVDIHAQSQHLSLMDKASHLDYLDAYGGTLESRRRFGQQVQALRGLQNETEDITRRQADTERRRDYLAFQLQEIESAGLIDGEEAELENERRVLSSAEKLKELAFEAAEALDGDESGSTPASAALQAAGSALDRAAGIDDKLKNQANAVRDSLYTIAEAARDLRSYGNRIDADPARLEEIETRLRLIRDLKRKYGACTGDIMAFAQKARTEIENIASANDRKAQLAAEVVALIGSLSQQGAEMSTKRKAAALRLEVATETELKELGMSRVRFRVEVAPLPTGDSPAVPDGAAFETSGLDHVQFLTATNPGEPFQPLEKIASTGELSRFTLAIKTALAGANMAPVLVFDEIDIGVGGRSGDVIGRKLATLAFSHQVVCVTHLAQIACYADHHFSVGKDYVDGRTVSRLSLLEGERRVEELTLMLSGSSTSRSGRDGSMELIENARRFHDSLREIS